MTNNESREGTDFREADGHTGSSELGGVWL